MNVWSLTPWSGVPVVRSAANTRSWSGERFTTSACGATTIGMRNGIPWGFATIT